MPYTVPYAFEMFFEAINLSGEHRETANTRKDNVVATLSKSFSIVDSFATGSIPKYTALKDHADLDVFVVLNYTKHIKDKTPKQVLADVRSVLAEWRTGARRNGQAVTLHYTTWPNVDIVPVSFTSNTDGSVKHYNVPDENSGQWIVSRPKTHSVAIEGRASVCGENFRKAIKMVKHWSRGHGDYLQSYHLEAMALRIFDSAMTDITWDIERFFDSGLELVSSPLYYLDGFVDEYLTYKDREEVKKRFQTAAELSRNAWYQTYNGRTEHEEGMRLWRQLFGDKFPAYGK